MPKPLQSMPTVQQWIDRTTVTTLGFRHARKNPDLLAIDTALRNYEMSARTAVMPGETPAATLTRTRIQVLNLLDIIKKCTVWVEHKRMALQIESSNRLTTVLDLARCAEAEVERHADSVGSLSRTRGRLTHQAGQASTVMSPAARLAAQTRFAMVRTAMLQQGTGKGLALSVASENNSTGMNPRHYEGSSLQNQFGDDRTNADYKFLFDYARQARLELAQIIYLGQDERWQHQIRIEDGLAYRLAAPDGSLQPSPLPPGSQGNFIISNEMNLYFLNLPVFEGEIAARKARGETAEFRHSSFMGGKPVLFAGGMEISKSRAGLITMVDSLSGHYKPNLIQFYKALQVLKENGVDMSNVDAMHALMKDDGDGGSFASQALFKAATLLSRSLTQIKVASEICSDVRTDRSILTREFGMIG
jgi:hypothetical protein